MTGDSFVLFSSMPHFEKLEVNLTPESIYMKEECGLIKHTDIILYIYIYIIYILHYIYITLYIYYIIYYIIYILHIYIIVCTPLFFPLGSEPPIGPQFLGGVCRERGMTFFKGIEILR